MWHIISTGLENIKKYRRENRPTAVKLNSYRSFGTRLPYSNFLSERANKNVLKSKLSASFHRILSIHCCCYGYGYRFFFSLRFSPVCSFSYESKGAKATHHALNNIFDNQNDGNGIVKQCYTAPCRDTRRAKIRRKWPIFPQLDSLLSCAMMGVCCCVFRLCIQFLASWNDFHWDSSSFQDKTQHSTARLQ